MDCTTFVSRFTDYLDGVLSRQDSRAMEDHLAGCGSCVRYKNVVEQGRSLLMSLPTPELGDDFSLRLESRLVHAAEVVPTDDVASRAPALAVLGIAVLLTVVAWAPLILGGSPMIQLQPIVVDHAPVTPRTLPTRLTSRPVDPSERLGEGDVRIWEDLLLYEYSPLSRRYQETARTRQVGFESGR